MDIVERLRNPQRNDLLVAHDAADEIESLRQQLAALKSDYCNIDSAADAQAAELYKVKQQLAECKSKWEHFENSVAEKSMQCLSLEKELATVTKERDELVAALKKLLSGCDTGERNPDGTQRGRSMPEKWQVDQAHAALAKLGADKEE